MVDAVPENAGVAALESAGDPEGAGELAWSAGAAVEICDALGESFVEVGGGGAAAGVAGG